MHGAACPAYISQATGERGSPSGHGYIVHSILPPSFDLTFQSPVVLPPPHNTPRRSTPSVATPVAHRWVPVTCSPATTHEVIYVFMLPGHACCSDPSTSAVTYAIPSQPPVALSLQPLPSLSVCKAQPVVPPPGSLLLYLPLWLPNPKWFW